MLVAVRHSLVFAWVWHIVRSGWSACRHAAPRRTLPGSRRRPAASTCWGATRPRTRATTPAPRAPGTAWRAVELPMAVRLCTSMVTALRQWPALGHECAACCSAPCTPVVYARTGWRQRLRGHASPVELCPAWVAMYAQHAWAHQVWRPACHGVKPSLASFGNRFLYGMRVSGASANSFSTAPFTEQDVLLMLREVCLAPVAASFTLGQLYDALGNSPHPASE